MRASKLFWIGLIISSSINGSLVTFTVPQDSTAIEIFTATVSDGEYIDSQDFTVTVDPINDMPYFTVNAMSDFVSEDSEFAFDFSNVIEDIDNDLSDL